jgi:hypothetical protein
MDFDSMQRASLDMIKLTSYLNYYSTLDDELSVQKSQVKNGPQDLVTATISIFTGFIDGSFRAGNTSFCRTSLKMYTGSF